jgi:phage shock protein PspC (stress-responsive transcriptional regulator)
MTQIPEQEHGGVRTENLRDYSQLRRSRTDRKFAGVAGGLGRHLNIDPTVLRVLFVVLCFFGGAGFVLYGAAWLLVPEEGTDRAIVSTNVSTRLALLLGAAVVAVFLLVGDSWGRFGFPWPLAVLALVVFLILMNRDKPMTDQPPQNSAEPWPGGEQPADTATATLPAQDETGYGPQPPAPPWAPTEQSYQPPLPRPDRGMSLFGPTMALLAVALGALGLYDVAGGHVIAPAYAALALGVIGVMLVVGAWVGRAGALILVGAVAALALAVTSAVHGADFDRGRRVTVDPASAAATRDSYSVPTGQINLDLRDVRDPASLDGRTIRVHANVGQIIVTLPPDVGATVRADVSGPGAVDLPGRHRGGIDTLVTQNITPAGETAHLNLNLDLSVGHIEVRQ